MAHLPRSPVYEHRDHAIRSRASRDVILVIRICLLHLDAVGDRLVSAVIDDLCSASSC
jgi:hypothetical protein